MSLSSALSIAQSALLNNSRQTSVISTNVANQGNADYARRSGVLVSQGTGGARLIQIQRAANEQLMRQNLTAQSSYEGQKALMTGLDKLMSGVNGIDNASSASALIGKLREALDLYGATPSNKTLGDTVVETASQLAQSLNNANTSVQATRTQADADIANQVDTLNELLTQFKDANTAVVNGTRAGRDVSDSLDQRDGLLKQIANIVPVSTITRGDNDLVVMTSGGAMLFETNPRSVTFERSETLAAGVDGNAVYIDGVALDAGTGANTTAQGSIAGLLQLRDTVAPTLQNQLDEITRGLITAFAETSNSGNPALTGLFTWDGAPELPADGTLIAGLSRQIKVNDAYKANSELLRDGGANGADHTQNDTGAASFSDRLIALSDALDEPRAFSSDAGLESSTRLEDFASSSVGWLESARKSANSAAETKAAYLNYASSALSSATGVNIDQEMSTLLDLEHSYSATARIISTVDAMLAELLAAVR
ncbi:flagellar hook-associated protein FlgK [Limoniibacter endophyticus]|uniref:Flagellar hook-associated protein 1 n=1 Tax=Limoniibacter endophyticus TaxID=1565040 RepID=A0A8J3GF40_9HYPH|nr:flagellar hook-associated protein FlgK [Limoniibacter endophyticus]GHC64486.1 flagellar hook protein FlgK [Limoniibacter endophyticus]